MLGNRLASFQYLHARAKATLLDLLSALAIGGARTNQRRSGGGAGRAVSRVRRSRCLAPRLPGHGASGERSASSVVSVAGCLQLGKPRQTPASPSSSAPVRWLLFLSSRPVLLPCGGASPAVSHSSAAGRRAGGALCEPFPPARGQRWSRAPKRALGAATPQVWGAQAPRGLLSLRLAVPLSRWVTFTFQFSPSPMSTVSAPTCGDFETDNLTGPGLERMFKWECLRQEGDEHFCLLLSNYSLALPPSRFI